MKDKLKIEIKTINTIAKDEDHSQDHKQWMIIEDLEISGPTDSSQIFRDPNAYKHYRK